jgi:hypothetical protein
MKSIVRSRSTHRVATPGLLAGVIALALAAAFGAPGALAAGASAVRACGAAPHGYYRCLALVRTVTQANGQVTPLATSTPQGYGPADLISAYNLAGSAGQGTGETIALVDAQDDPSAEADLGVYRSTYGLGACTTANGCFRKVNEAGHATPLPSGDTGWGEEISLDLDMASAICPNCKILLVEASTASTADLGAAVNTAASLGATQISNSYGGGEDGTITAAESYYRHPGIDVVASSGDDGYGVEYPASSQYVTAVGGTRLVRASNGRGWTETVWNSGGGAPGSGCSSYIAKPAWQHDAGCAKRTVADVAADADPSTGVAVYDTYGSGSQSWQVYGGTSVASPLVAAVDALAGGRSPGTAYGSFAYSHPSAFYDVTSGTDVLAHGSSCSGSTTYLCTAGVGYDGPTGIGTPDGAAPVTKTTPSITWATPAPITYGTPLSATLLNASASVPGTFVYAPAAGAVLAPGPQPLSVTFTPTDTTDYTTATAQVSLTVTKAPTALTTLASAAGTQITDAATLSGGVSPAGTLTFKLYGPGDTGCGTPLATSTTTVTGDGTYQSAAATAGSAGTYRWVASYGGDANNAASTGSCGDTGESVVIAPTAPQITGTVTNAAGAGVANICVYPYIASTGARTADAAACTDATGAYTLALGATGTYNVVFYDATGTYVTQWYSGAAYESGATPVSVTGGTPASGVNAVLATPGATTTGPVTEITGTVTDTAGHGLANICVYPYVAASGTRTSDPAACTDSAGKYALVLGTAGTYNVVFYDASGTYVTQWFSGAAYEGGATPVSVTTGTPTTGINAVLGTPGGTTTGAVTQITGTVSDAAGTGLANICVYPYVASSGTRTADPAACTNTAGVYTLTLGASGTYTLVFYDASGAFLTQWYAGAQYEGAATPVSVASGMTVTGIGATLARAP